MDDKKIKFIDVHRSEADREIFYKTIQVNIDILDQA